MSFKYRPPAARASALDAFGWANIVDRWSRQAVHAVPDRYRHVLKNYPETLAGSPHTAGNLVLMGPQGTGKTTVALAALRPCLEAPPAARLVVRAWSFAELVLQIGSQETEAETEAKHAAVLFLDDLGIQLSDAQSEAVFRILDHRMSRTDRPMIITSDTDWTALMGMLGYRGTSIVSRLRDDAQSVVMSGQDLRAERDHRIV